MHNTFEGFIYFLHRQISSAVHKPASLNKTNGNELKGNKVAFSVVLKLLNKTGDINSFMDLPIRLTAS